MSATLTSTKAKVHDPEKVREVLDSYEWEGVEIHFLEEETGWILELTNHDPDWDSAAWPQALRSEEVPHEEQYPDEEERYDALSDRFCENGDKGFLALLRDLAPYLDTPLLILVSGSARSNECSGQVWRVQPGDTEVETLEV
jgi:hypothetical protein